MPAFGTRSTARLDTCHPDLKRLFRTVVLSFDCTIICGHRGMTAQHEAFEAEHSKVDWPDSRHNKIPSTAADVGPWPLDWDDIPRFYFFGGYVMRAAHDLGIPLTWGGDWDNDLEVSDQKFMDLVHYQLRD